MRQAARAPEFALAHPARHPMIAPAQALLRAWVVILRSPRRPKNPSDVFSCCTSLPKTKRDSSRDSMKARKGHRGPFARRAQNDNIRYSPSAPTLALLLWALAFALAVPAPLGATMPHEISLAHPGQHQFHVTMIVPGVQGSVVVQMPAWNALYQIRDFAYRVSDFRAADASRNALPVRRLDKQTWRVEVPAGGLVGGQGEMRIEYSSFWDDPGPFDTQLNAEHAFLNLAEVLCYIPERRGEDTAVHFLDLPPGWRVAEELRHEGPQTPDLAGYQAENYDALVDAPVEIGRFDEWSFSAGGQTSGQAGGKTIRVVYHGDAVDHAAVTPVRTGIWSHPQFLADLGAQITELESRPARNWQSAEESSLDTWFDKYPLYDQPGFSISYYNKGQLLGLALDILIRDATDNRASLDDVLRRLNQQYAQRRRFYADSTGIEDAVAEVVRAANPGLAGDFSGFFKRYVSATDEMPFADLLSRAGLGLKTQGEKRAALGFAVERDSTGIALVADLDLSSSAAQAGLREGDAILSIDGAEMPRKLERWLRGRSPGETVRVLFRRAGIGAAVAFALGQLAAQVFAVVEMPRPRRRQSH